MNIESKSRKWHVEFGALANVFSTDMMAIFTQVKLSCYSLNFIEQAAHYDHKPRAAWLHVRLLVHRRSAAGWAECMIYSAIFTHG